MNVLLKEKMVVSILKKPLCITTNIIIYNRLKYFDVLLVESSSAWLPFTANTASFDLIRAVVYNALYHKKNFKGFNGSNLIIIPVKNVGLILYIYYSKVLAMGQIHIKCLEKIMG